MWSCLLGTFSSYKPLVVSYLHLLQSVYLLLSFSDACMNLSTSLDSLHSCKMLIFLIISLSNLNKE
jgi:hypothetical protein